MQGKKRYLALILFVLIGLVTFSFANPEEELEPIEETTSNVSEAPNKKEEEKKETTILQPLEQAEEAVEQAEENPTQQTIQNAITIIERVIEEEPIRESLIQRVEVAEEAIDVAALVQTVENMVKTATKHEDIDASETYFDNNNVEEEAQNMTEGPAKDNIADRIEYLNLVFADDSAPIISGIENGVTTKENVKITITDTTNYNVKVTLNNNKIDFADEFKEDGIYVINVVDAALHPTTITFTIDKTAPTYKFYKEGSSLDKDEIKPIIIDDKLYFKENVRVRFVEETSYFTQYIHNNFINNENKTTIKTWTREAKNDGEHTMKVTDAVGNSTEITFYIDTTAPTYKFYKEGSSLDKDEIKPIIIDDKLYFKENVRVRFVEETSYFTQYIHNNFINNENKTTIKAWTREAKNDGEHTMKVTDALGHATEVTFIIDTKAPKFAPEKWSYTLEADKNATFVCPDMSQYVTDEYSGVKSVVVDKWYTENWSIPNQTKPGEFTCRYISTDKLENSVSNDIFYTVKDTTAPTVLRNGEEVVRIEAGEKYTDLGASVTDNVDADRQIGTEAPSYINRYQLGADGVSSGPYVGRVKSIDTTIPGKYLIVYYTEDAAGNKSNKDIMTSKRWVIVKSRDEEAPTISLNGDETVYLALGENYVEPGVKVVDNIDGESVLTTPKTIELYNINDQLVGSVDTVDTSIAGKYVLTYETTDIAGNISNEVKRTIEISSTIVKTAEQLRALFADSANVKDKIIHIRADLDMTNIEWKAVNGVGFTIEGNGHTISNLTYETDGHVGIFANDPAANDVSISNLIIDNAKLSTTSTDDKISAGFFVGYADRVDSVTIKNCEVKNSTISGPDYVGGFVGYTAGYNVITDGPVYTDILIENSKLIGSTLTGGGSTGGAVAHAGGNVDTTVIVRNFTAENNTITGESVDKTGIVLGTAHIGKTYLEKISYSNNTVFGTANSNTVTGRFVPLETGVYVYEIPEVETLTEALANAYNGQTIKISNDIKLDTQLDITAEKTVRIDLNDKKLTITNNNALSAYTLTPGGTTYYGRPRMIQNNGTLEISNGTIINETTDAFGVIDNRAGASLVLKDVKIVEHGMGDGAAIKDRGGKVTIEDSEIEVIHDSTKGNFTKGNRGISVAGTSILKNIAITTNAPEASGLVIESGTATIEKVNVDSYHTALSVNGGNVEITDTKAISENYHAIFVTNDTTKTTVVINSGEYTGKWGLYASIDDGNQDNADVAVKVYDGVFTATKHAAVLGANTKDSEYNWELQLIGGTYNTDVKKYIVSGFKQDPTGKIVPIA